MSVDRISTHLYQGSREELTHAKRYAFVVSAAVERNPPKDVRYLHLKLDDVPTPWADPQHKAWRKAVRYAARKVAEHVRRGDKTLVVCAAGLNRSGLVTAMALRMLGYLPSEAIDRVRAARGPEALSNPSFVQAVREMKL